MIAVTLLNLLYCMGSPLQGHCYKINKTLKKKILNFSRIYSITFNKFTPWTVLCSNLDNSFMVYCQKFEGDYVFIFRIDSLTEYHLFYLVQLKSCKFWRWSICCWSYISVAREISNNLVSSIHCHSIVFAVQKNNYSLWYIYVSNSLVFQLLNCISWN